MTGTRPKLSIVVPAFNEEKLLPRSLEAIRTAAGAFEERGWDWELIVCDNNSTDGTAAIARAHGARVVFEPVNQIARARNTGASVATGDWLLFVDADSEPSRDLLAEAVALLDRGGLAFVGAVVRLSGEVPPMAASFVRGWNALSRALRWMAGSFMLVEASAFREVGGFDERFFAGEEVDLSRRLKAWARRQGRQAAIISRHALVSSPRRMTLYSQRQILRFFLRAVFRPWRTTASREACSMWYDGKR